MVVVLAVKKWRHYLMGGHFIIRTDQRSLKFLTEQRLFNEEQFKWATKLIGYDFEIQYRPGKENSAADALSRRVTFAAVSVVQMDDWADWEVEIQQDPRLLSIRQDLITCVDAHPGYELRNGLLFYKGRLVLPKESSRIPLLLREFHDSPAGGHLGFFRTYKRVVGVVFWEGMKADIKDYIAGCDICQRNKYETLSPAGLLKPLPIPTKVWTDISMDFIGGLPKAHGKDTILVVVDRLSKFAHFIAMGHPFTAKEVAELFLKEIVRLHGFPSSIVSDRDQIFMSHFWRELFRRAGTQLKFSTAYHPQTDGQTEVTNHYLEAYLRCLTGTKPKQWPTYLSWAEF